MNLKELFKKHLEKRMQDASAALNILGYSSLILGSGSPFIYYEDDADAAFRINPHFAHWCPAKGPHHFIKFEPGKKPLLVYYAPDDYWYTHEQLGDPFWAEFFDIIEIGSKEKLFSTLGNVTQGVFLGNETNYALSAGIKINCELLMARLNWCRRFKSDYEIHCLSEANKLAAKAHMAAKNAFLNGDSDYEIHLAYLKAIQAVDTDLPYTCIVALDSNAAVLHYQGIQHKKNNKVMLIDSGASFHHYGSDITRTYANKECDSLFTELLAATKKVQQEICTDIKANLFFPDLHERCHKSIAEILDHLGIIKVKGDYQRALDENITKTFFPHGLGHMLGIQVHDIGAKQADINGNPAPQMEGKILYRSLRFVGKLEDGLVVTIEPGIYFIPSLINTLKTTLKESSLVNWELVDRLIPFGGIRIEDNVLVTKEGHRNLTREFLAD